MPDGGPAPDGEPTPGGGGGPAPASGATRWTRTLGGAGTEYVQSVAAGRDGTIVAATLIGAPPGEPPQRLGFVWLDGQGRVVRAREHLVSVGELHLPVTSLRVGALGSVFLLTEGLCISPDGGCPEMGAGPIRGLTLLKLSPTGELVWQVELPGDLASTIAVDEAESVVVAFRNFVEVTLRKVGSDGRLLWERKYASATGGNLAFDPGGNVIVAGGLGVTKLDADGGLLWEMAIAGGDTSEHGAIFAVGASRDGTIAVAGHHGAGLSLAGSRVAPPPGSDRGVFLAAIGPDGRARFLTSAGEWNPAPGGSPPVEMEVEPDGSVALLVPAEVCGFRVERWGLDGARGWRRDFRPESCVAGGLAATDLAIAPSHQLIVAGAYDSATDFGSGLVRPDGTRDGWVIGLEP